MDHEDIILYRSYHLNLGKIIQATAECYPYFDYNNQHTHTHTHTKPSEFLKHTM